MYIDYVIIKHNKKKFDPVNKEGNKFQQELSYIYPPRLQGYCGTILDGRRCYGIESRHVLRGDMHSNTVASVVYSWRKITFYEKYHTNLRFLKTMDTYTYMSTFYPHSLL